MRRVLWTNSPRSKKRRRATTAFSRTAHGRWTTARASSRSRQKAYIVANSLHAPKILLLVLESNWSLKILSSTPSYKTRSGPSWISLLESPHLTAFKSAKILGRWWRFLPCHQHSKYPLRRSMVDIHRPPCCSRKYPLLTSRALLRASRAPWVRAVVQPPHNRNPHRSVGSKRSLLPSKSSSCTKACHLRSATNVALLYLWHHSQSTPNHNCSKVGSPRLLLTKSRFSSMSRERSLPRFQKFRWK